MDESNTTTVGVEYLETLEEYCDTESFRANCSESEVILLETARYGRMNIGRCVETPMGYIGCYRDVLLLADRRCSGKRLCEIHIPNAEFESTRPCLRELKSYLEISYICIPGNSNSANYLLLNAPLYDNNYCVIKNSRGRAYCRQDLQPHKPGNQSIIDNATTTYLILHISVLHMHKL